MYMQKQKEKEYEEEVDEVLELGVFKRYFFFRGDISFIQRKEILE